MKNRHVVRADLPEGADNPLNAAVVERDRSTLDMVSEAVAHNQTMLAFQPVMQARVPHQTVFYEGLIRVLDPTGRVIPAGEFMPDVEDREIGRELDCTALEHGLRLLSKFPDVRIAINMSARSIGYRRWGRVLSRFLNKDKMLGERLILEMTEHSAMSMPEVVVDFMGQMQQHGIAFALDDFGASALAFRHFREFFFDAVKIDGQFIRNVHINADNQSLTRALINVAREFDMLTVAEAVETREEAEFLVSIGVDCLQGYLFGAPTVRAPWVEEMKHRSRA
jgi:EAL domain-containing protein (putative c-di-GMP-specific phosphodiesterase class I)